jgi:hypothetical protein
VIADGHDNLWRACSRIQRQRCAVWYALSQWLNRGPSPLSSLTLASRISHHGCLLLLPSTRALDVFWKNRTPPELLPVTSPSCTSASALSCSAPPLCPFIFIICALLAFPPPPSASPALRALRALLLLHCPSLSPLRAGCSLVLHDCIIPAPLVKELRADNPRTPLHVASFRLPQ